MKLPNMTTLFLALFLNCSFAGASPCMENRFSCLKFSNDTLDNATIICNDLYQVFASSLSFGSTQLDTSWGDGLGAPEPSWQYCRIKLSNPQNPDLNPRYYFFHFRNPYWGPIITFNLSVNKTIDINVTDRYGNATQYTIDVGNVF